MGPNVFDIAIDLVSVPEQFESDESVVVECRVS
jgi:hypothetical protein